MLHKINPPLCIGQLKQIIQFQRCVLAFACKLRSPLSLQQKNLEAEFGTEVGGWLWGKLWITRRTTGIQEPSDLHKAVKKFADLMSREPTLETLILDAFDHDIRFQNHLSDSEFTFTYNFLSQSARQAIRELLELFYTDLLALGFPGAIHGEKESLNRDKVVDAFWKANPKLEVCPACDRPRSPMVNNKIYSDVDHFLPKSSYPFLSIHYFNLVPLCLDCNRTLKGDRDPIDDSRNAPLTHTFHPYLNPALDQVNVKTYRNTEGVRIIQIEDKVGMPSRRVDSINRVFKLEREWLDSLRYAVDSIGDELRRAGERLRRGGNSLDLQDFRLDIEDMLRERLEKRGQRHFYILHSSYLVFALIDNVELDELFAQFNGV